VTKSRTIRQASYAACTKKEIQNLYKSFVGKLEASDPLGNLIIDGRQVIKTDLTGIG
jgi:hypothetical protein